jgi:hypothetical protein
MGNQERSNRAREEGKRKEKKMYDYVGRYATARQHKFK